MAGQYHGPLCCYCLKEIGRNQRARIIRGCNTYVGWRHDRCDRPRTEAARAYYAEKIAEAKEFVEILRSGDRSSLHPALRW